MLEDIVYYAHFCCFIVSAISLYCFFAEADVVSVLENKIGESGAISVKDVFSSLTMCPLFFFINCTSFVPPKWQVSQLFRTIGAFFFINHYQYACCHTKTLFDKISTNSTELDPLKINADQVRLTRGAFVTILISTACGFLTSFLLEAFLKKTLQEKQANVSSVSKGDSATAAAGSSGGLSVPLKITYVFSALIIIAATAVLMGTGDACGNSAGSTQFSQTFPVIALLLLSGVILNDARALDIAIALLLLNVVTWQPTDFSETKMKVVSALLQSAADVCIVGITITAVVQVREQNVNATYLSVSHEKNNNYHAGEEEEENTKHSSSFAAAAAVASSSSAPRNENDNNFNPSTLSGKIPPPPQTLVDRLRSAGFKLSAWCFLCGIVGSAMVWSSSTKSSEIWIAAFAGYFVPIMSLASCIYGIDAAFVPAAFCGIRVSSHLAQDLSGTTGFVRSGWILLIVACFAATASSLRVPQGDADALFEKIKKDTRLMASFLLFIVSALAYRSTDETTHDDFLRSMYLGLLIVISLARSCSATVAFLAAASYVASSKLWFVDNAVTITELPACLFVVALWIFLLFHPRRFKVLPMHAGVSHDYSSSSQGFYSSIGTKIVSDDDDDDENENSEHHANNANAGYGSL